MAQKPMLRLEVGMQALRVQSVPRGVVCASAGVQGAWVGGCVAAASRVRAMSYQPSPTGRRGPLALLIPGAIPPRTRPSKHTHFSSSDGHARGGGEFGCSYTGDSCETTLELESLRRVTLVLIEKMVKANVRKNRISRK